MQSTQNDMPPVSNIKRKKWPRSHRAGWEISVGEAFVCFGSAPVARASVSADDYWAPE